MISVVFDIETAPRDEALADVVAEGDAVAALLAGPPEAVTSDAVDAATAGLRKGTDSGWRYGRTKDPGKLREALARDHAGLMASASRACSFDPLRGRVVSIAAAYWSPAEGALQSYVESLRTGPEDEADALDAAERRVISTFLTDWAAAADCLVGHNSMVFDFPFIAIRAALLGIGHLVPAHLWGRRYATTPHLDTMQWLARWESRNWTGLDAACRAIGVGSPKAGMDGSKVAGLVAEGRWEEVESYNLADVVDRTWPLYRALVAAIPGHRDMATQLEAARGAGQKGA